jgi:hypothetical protein
LYQATAVGTSSPGVFLSLKELRELVADWRNLKESWLMQSAINLKSGMPPHLAGGRTSKVWDKKRRLSRLLKHLEEPLTAFNINVKAM